MTNAAASGAVAYCDPKIYLVLHVHPGWKYNLGSVLENAAKTHRKEIIANSFPDLPKPAFETKCDRVVVAYCNNVDAQSGEDIEQYFFPDQGNRKSDPNNALSNSLKDIIAAQPDGKIKYLSIFCHSGWLGGATNAVFMHPISARWANLEAGRLSVFNLAKFAPKPQIRIFGCYAGYDPDSICEALSKRIPGSTVYGYNFHGGAYGTNDREIGHGIKAVPAQPPNPKQGDTWLATYSPGKKSTFRKFP